MALPALLYGAVIGQLVYAGCDWLDEHREKKRESLRRTYERAERKKIAKSIHRHHHHQSIDTDTKYIGDRPYYDDDDSDSDSDDDTYPYDQRHICEQQQQRQRRLNNYNIGYQPPRNAGLIEPSYPSIPTRKALPAAPVVVGNNTQLPSYREPIAQSTSPIPSHRQSFPTVSSPSPSPSPAPAPTPPPTSKQRSRVHPRRSHTGHVVPLREINSMTFKELVDLLQDPTLNRDCRKAVRQRMTQLELLYYRWYKQQQEQQQSIDRD